ncbi:hypothetical protein PL8927_510017 [Planktothrix serta PCC 8927]|uniref:Uncharacterized protein n=1 Tax=Planktothrix serta PCC 8927 TaxID=671068 RepID=A0A7Z9BRQ7_9CYAN|nr:hypothetical protein [Planktothrix serta]VXD15989.1 hypothetical protein PL8927_510017 [Planktothrix serta PCC 8927]
MSFIIYRQPTVSSEQLVLGDWTQLLIDSVPLYGATTPHEITDLIPADLTAIYGRKALITVEDAEIVIAFGRDVTDTDKLFIPPNGNIEIEVGKQKVSATVLTGEVIASVQVWVAKYSKVL